MLDIVNVNSLFYCLAWTAVLTHTKKTAPSTVVYAMKSMMTLLAGLKAALAWVLVLNVGMK